MHIIDNEGKRIEVTDLDTAIEQAADRKHWQHADGGVHEGDKLLRAYWADVHEKFLNLKTFPGSV